MQPRTAPTENLTHERDGARAFARRFAFHPYALTAFAVLSMYSANVTEASPSDVVIPLTVLLLVACFSVLLFRIFYATPERAAIAASFAAVITLFYGHACVLVQTILGSHVRYVRWRYMLMAWAILMLVGLLLIRVLRFSDRQVSHLLNIFSIALLGFALCTTAVSLIGGRPNSESNQAEIALADEELPQLKVPAITRDVYFLIFDRYGSLRTMRDEFGLDNSQFYDELRHRGFHCLEESQTNYPRTVISMASILNMQYHGEEILGDVEYGRQIADHNVGRLFRQVGYSYYHLGNFYGPLRSNRNAVYSLPVSPLPSEFADGIYSQTPLGQIYPMFSPEWGGIADRRAPDVARRHYQAVEDAARQPGPKFVYAHFLPYHAVPPTETTASHTLATNERILSMVDTIVRESEVAPIIVIQADEGPYLGEADASKDRLTQIRKRTGIIAAFLVPGIDAEEIPMTITPVNTFRLLFSHYFDAEIELLPDRTFYWERDAAQLGTPGNGRFVDVTEALASQDATKVPVASASNNNERTVR